ncbi:hypothetical protein HBI56_166840 [Parastagonospora nodorum]|nr:hypothetical protein HBH53_053520 [Parastagonospora nodorum]KAH3983072.1 hypothetical protein HBH52_069200 [Parastagonospora nodorum]KAH4045657.1 hypothetical protein HBH49_200670 [Parastagonospora nodorum]KAH4069641.1 hypothetical protein HBH50_101900 [Parastagonospora nodorum]KAH4090050.1 hypothetical protein HBH48_105680 [Parastagonospora nodorum]
MEACAREPLHPDSTRDVVCRLSFVVSHQHVARLVLTGTGIRLMTERHLAACTSPALDAMKRASRSGTMVDEARPVPEMLIAALLQASEYKRLYPVTSFLSRH